MSAAARCELISFFCLNAIWNEPSVAAVIFVTEQSGALLSKNVFKPGRSKFPKAMAAIAKRRGKTHSAGTIS